MSDKKKIIVTQKKSPIGRQSYQKKTLIGLGLNKIGRSKQLEDTPKENQRVYAGEINPLLCLTETEHH